VDVAVGELYPVMFLVLACCTFVMARASDVETNDFILSKDGNTLMRWMRIDVTPDPMTPIDLKGRLVRDYASPIFLLRRSCGLKIAQFPN